MTEKGYKGGLVSRVKNEFSGRKYVVSTAQEIGRDYWSTTVFPAMLFGFLPALTKQIFVIVRNSKEDAHAVHREVKEIVSRKPEDDWFEAIPHPEPPEGFSEDAMKVLRRKLGNSIE